MTRPVNWFPLFCLLLFFSSFSQATYQEFKRLGVDDGLPNATVYSVNQDDAGFIWLTSTNSGLLRFDGYSFDEFEVLTQSEKAELGSQDVGVLLIDPAKNLWAGTWGYGLSRIDGTSGALTRYVVETDNPNSLASMQIQSLLMAHDGQLWIGSTGGLNRIANDGKMHRIGTGQQGIALVNNRIWSLAQTADGAIWIGTSAGLQRWTEQNGLEAPLLPFPDSDGRDNEVRALFSLGSRLWVGTRNGLFSLDPKQATFNKIPFFDYEVMPIINAMAVDEQGMLLIGTYDGLFQVDPRQQQFVPFLTDNSLLPAVNVRTIFLDRTGVLWLGSRESGVYYTKHQKSAFNAVQALVPKVDPQQLQIGITSVFKQKNIIWLGSADQLMRIDLTSQALQKFATGSRVNTIAADPTGNVFVATDNGLWAYDPQLAKLNAVDEPFNLAAGVADNIRDLTIQPDGTFWIGLWGEGVLHWDPKRHLVQQYLAEHIKSKVGDAVQSLWVTGDEVWVGSRYSGVFVINAVSGQVSQPSADEQSQLKLPSLDVLNIAAGPGDSVAIATARGVVIYQRNTKQQVLLDQRSGLPTDTIFGVYTDQQQNIWFQSAKGLSVKRFDSQRLITFTKQDGLVATELAANSFFDDKEGNFLQGTIRGVSLIEPARIWINQQEPKVAVSRILINNQPLALNPVSSNWPSLQLKPTDTSIEFEFASLDFHDISRNRFIYRLAGFDQDWIVQNNKRSAYYSNLPAGDYVLELKGSNNHGLYSSTPMRVALKVLPPWWQYRSVQIFAAIITLLLILLFHQYRLRHIQQINRLLQVSVQEKAKAQLILESKVAERTKALEESSTTLSLRTKQLEKSLIEIAKANRELKRLDRLKDEFISTVSHELRTPLTSIRGAVGLVAQNVVEPGSASYDVLIGTAVSNCERLAQLINDLLDVQKFEAGKFTLATKVIDLKELCAQAVQAMESYAVHYKVTLQLLAPDKSQCFIEADPLRIRQVVDNLLSNAIKFSHSDGQVSLRLTENVDSILLEVIDLGVGIPEQFHGRIFEKFTQADASDSRAKDGTGLGLTICKHIVESHQGQIGFVSMENIGTTFWVRLNRQLQLSQQPTSLLG